MDSLDIVAKHETAAKIAIPPSHKTLFTGIPLSHSLFQHLTQSAFLINKYF